MNKPNLNTTGITEELRQSADVAAYDTDLIVASGIGGELAPFTEETFKEVAATGDFLPRVQLYGGNSTLCKKGKIGIGHYGIPRSADEVDDLGAEIDVIVIHGRAKAMRTQDKAVLQVLFDPKHPEFQKIIAESSLKDSGCMFGPEYLLYVPSVGEFVTFFMSSKTARKASGGVQARMHKAATLKAEFIETKKYSWHGPKAVACSSPLDVPSTEDIQKAVTKFMAQKETSVEVVEEGTSTGRER